MKRRGLVVAIAAGAAAAGAGVAVWRQRAAADPAAAAIWALEVERPGGGSLALASLRGGPLLVNFWATWCPPCVKEMPLIDAFYRAQQPRGWRVVGLAVDGPTPVREYLARLPMSFPIGLAGLGGVELTRQLGNPSGALPFTVVIDGGGRVVERKLGAMAAADLERWSESVR